LRYVLLLFLVGCIDQIDARWQLDHDHVVAVRATPPQIRDGEGTDIDALVAHVGAPVSIDDPLSAEVASQPDPTLYADGPIPVEVMLTFARSTNRASLDPLHVRKTVWIGEPRDNPAMPPVMFDGAPAGDEIVVPIGRDVYLSVDAGDMRVNWLTNVGTLFQDDEPTAFVRVTDADRHDGQLVAVVRDSAGGVAWQVWPMRAE
jgi:hypothetical protein